MSSQLPDHEGRGLTFLVSQPRAGSTLLQRMLGAHPGIATAGEPWLALHAVLPLRPDLWQARFNEGTFKLAFEALPNSREAFLEGSRQSLLQHYRTWCLEQHASCCLDKTPRYYYILPELRELFPQARIVVLVRNPLAVLTSICNTWIGQRWFHLYDSADDLQLAPDLLANSIRDSRLVDHVIHYESLVRHPQTELSSLLGTLNLPWDDRLLRYNQSPQPQWTLGDPTHAHKKQRPDAHHIDRWAESLTDPQLWRCASDYLDQLGEETLNALGYSRVELETILDRCQPSRTQLLATHSLDELIRVPPAERRSVEFERLIWLNRVREKGWLGALKDGGLRLARKARRLMVRPIRTTMPGAAPPSGEHPMTSSGDPMTGRSNKAHEPAKQAIIQPTDDLHHHGRRRVPREVRVDRLPRESRPAA
ncbi:sulfotransferase family protein [Mucisphaera sp.]|uniref:sulfotransferase family protein n=1 Tax=Mucisphaera sp. TaxID=2913024 RepID=UPI003D1012A7